VAPAGGGVRDLHRGAFGAGQGRLRARHAIAVQLAGGHGKASACAHCDRRARMMAGRGRRGTAVIIVALLALASCAESGPSAAIRYAPPPAVPGATIPAGTTPCIVDRVSDGDTLVCSSGTVVRLI